MEADAPQLARKAATGDLVRDDMHGLERLGEDLGLFDQTTLPARNDALADGQIPNAVFSTEELAKELDMDPKLVESLSPDGRLVMLGASVFPQLDKKCQDEGLKAIDWLEKSTGKGKLGFKLRAKVVEMRDVQLQWSPISMSDDEIEARINRNREVIKVLDGAAPGTSAASPGFPCRLHGEQTFQGRHALGRNA